MQKHPVIGVVLFPDATQLDLTAPYEVFARIPGAEVHVISNTLDPVRTDRGLKIVPDTTYRTCPPIDVLFIPGGPGQLMAQEDEELMRFVREYAEKRSGIISSVCTGSLLLGAAGVLRRKKATTHWTCMDILSILGAEPVDKPVVEDGNVITGAGVANGLDLALHLAEKLAGKEATQRIARFIEYPHASKHTDQASLTKLSQEMLASNPHRKARLEASRLAAVRLGINADQQSNVRPR
jgi:cyclohexyl-isocyanide hydratase